MNIKHTIPSVLIGLSGIFGACTGKAQKIAPKALLENDIKLTALVKDTFSRKFSDEAKVIEFNKLLKKYGKSNDNYIIIDKKNCKSTVYSPEGKPLYKCEVALGRHVSDKRSGGYKVKGAKLRACTTPGEFDIVKEGSNKNSSNERLYGNRVLVIRGDHTQKAFKKLQTLALHRVPKTPMGKLRENVLKNKTIKDNRVSFGCINYLVESFDKMRSFIKGKSTKVYILPEEKGNSLHLEKQKDGSFKFFQTKYRYESQEK